MNSLLAVLALFLGFTLQIFIGGTLIYAMYRVFRFWCRVLGRGEE